MLPKFTRTFLCAVIGLLVISTLLMFHEPTRTYFDPLTGNLFEDTGSVHDVDSMPGSSVPIQGVNGGVIMPKLGNETAKQALGRATWKLMHTMTLRFPEKPTEDERHALDSYFHLQARLYPCGECATEFQLLLKKNPPQTSSRRAAALWLCHVHNLVNERLKKPVFDCAHLDDTYDCGCGDDPINKEASTDRDEQTGAGLIKGGKREAHM